MNCKASHLVISIHILNYKLCITKFMNSPIFSSNNCLRKKLSFLNHWLKNLNEILASHKSRVSRAVVRSENLGVPVVIRLA